MGITMMRAANVLAATLLIVACHAPAPQASPSTRAARDWTAFPPIVQVDGVSELWALSDIHGDYAALTRLLTAARLIPAVPDAPGKAQWSAGRAVLVVVGDSIDKGPDAPSVLRFFMALDAAAANAGGRVIVTMGNHEAEFLANPENPKASRPDGFDPELRAIGLSPAATAAGNNDVGAFVRNLPMAARVDDWFFVHAGKTDGKTIAELSREIQSEVDRVGFGAPVLSAEDSLLEARLSKSGPQWWDRTGDASRLLTEWTHALGARHLVMGHQPGAVAFSDGTTRQPTEMVAKYDGLLFLVDSGISVGTYGTGGGLLHVTNVAGSNISWHDVMPDGTIRKL